MAFDGSAAKVERTLLDTTRRCGHAFYVSPDGTATVPDQGGRSESDIIGLRGLEGLLVG